MRRSSPSPSSSSIPTCFPRTVRRRCSSTVFQRTATSWHTLCARRAPTGAKYASALLRRNATWTTCSRTSSSAACRGPMITKAYFTTSIRRAPSQTEQRSPKTSTRKCTIIASERHKAKTFSALSFPMNPIGWGKCVCVFGEDDKIYKKTMNDTLS